MTQEVTGSNPVSRANGAGSSVTERCGKNAKVEGASPSRPTKCRGSSEESARTPCASREDGASRTPPCAKLYLVVRADLPPGLQAAQLVHAGTMFCFEQPQAAGAWYSEVQNVVCLACPDKETLVRLAYEASKQGLGVSMFKEPDLNDEPTAFAVLGARLFPNLPKALKPPKV